MSTPARPGHQHRPSQPSGLSQVHMPPSSPEDTSHVLHGGHPSHHHQGFGIDGIHPTAPDDASVASFPSETNIQAIIEDPPDPPTARTKLLGQKQKYRIPDHRDCGEDSCNHGTFSPKPRYIRGYGSIDSRDGFGGRYPGGTGDGVNGSGDNAHGLFGDAVTDSLLGNRGGNKKSTTQWLAQKHGVRNSRLMYVDRSIKLPKLPLVLIVR